MRLVEFAAYHNIRLIAGTVLTLHGPDRRCAPLSCRLHPLSSILSLQAIRRHPTASPHYVCLQSMPPITASLRGLQLTSRVHKIKRSQVMGVRRGICRRGPIAVTYSAGQTIQLVHNITGTFAKNDMRRTATFARQSRFPVLIVAASPGFLAASTTRRASSSPRDFGRPPRPPPPAGSRPKMAVH